MCGIMELVSSVRRRVHFSVYVNQPPPPPLKITCPPYPFLFDTLYKKVSDTPAGDGKRANLFYSVYSLYSSFLELPSQPVEKDSCQDFRHLD